jgi:uncharacterized membrane protein YphA (DoxX/SURF4 family)
MAGKRGNRTGESTVQKATETTHLCIRLLVQSIELLHPLKKEELSMRRNMLLLAIRLLIALNFLPAIFLKFTGAPLSVALFTAMSNAVHGLVSQPVFRLGSGAFESVFVVMLLIPRTARLGAALIAIWMVGAILSHVFVLGYGLFFVSALATFFLSCLYLFLTRTQSSPD